MSYKDDPIDKKFTEQIAAEFGVARLLYTDYSTAVEEHGADSAEAATAWQKAIRHLERSREVVVARDLYRRAFLGLPLRGSAEPPEGWKLGTPIPVQAELEE